jgi:hypothetical protein
VTGPKRTHELITPEHRAKIALIVVRQSSLAQVRDHTGSAAVQYGHVQHALDFGFADANIRVIDADTGKSATSTVGRIGWAETFRLIGVRGTVAVLNREGKLHPTRHRGRLIWKRATLARVRSLLLNPAYAGLYIFGKTEMQFDRRAGHEGERVQRPVPEERWVRVSGLFPAYITPERQAEIRRRVEKNAFGTRHRPGRGRALCQGLLVCGMCGSTLTVADPGPETRSPYYQCTAKATKQVPGTTVLAQ